MKKAMNKKQMLASLKLAAKTVSDTTIKNQIKKLISENHTKQEIEIGSRSIAYAFIRKEYPIQPIDIRGQYIYIDNTVETIQFSIFTFTVKDIVKRETDVFAGFNEGGNIKLGNMFSFSKVYGSDYFVSMRYGIVQGTCGKYCMGCKEECYVKHSYRHNSVIDCHARNTLAFKADIEKAFDDLKKQIDSKRDKPLFVRVDQSGEIESEKEFKLWVEMAREYKNIQFYLYTKAFSLVMPTLNIYSEKGILPNNITILFSIWHEYGIKAYKQFEHLPQVKAFVVLDNVWNEAKYKEYGLHVTTTCKAYNEKGKLDHNITCERCRKCFNRIARHKVIGCYEH